MEEAATAGRRTQRFRDRSQGEGSAHLENFEATQHKKLKLINPSQPS